MTQDVPFFYLLPYGLFVDPAGRALRSVFPLCLYVPWTLLVYKYEHCKCGWVLLLDSTGECASVFVLPVTVTVTVTLSAPTASS